MVHRLNDRLARISNIRPLSLPYEIKVLICQCHPFCDVPPAVFKTERLTQARHRVEDTWSADIKLENFNKLLAAVDKREGCGTFSGLVAMFLLRRRGEVEIKYGARTFCQIRPCHRHLVTRKGEIWWHVTLHPVSRRQLGRRTGGRQG